MKLCAVLLNYNKRQIYEYPTTVTPVFYENGEYFVQNNHDMLNTILGFLVNSTDEKQIEKEIDAYVYKKHSTISSVVDYKKRANTITFEKKDIAPTDEDFVPLHAFDEEEVAVCEQTMVYGVLENGKIIVGSRDFIINNLKPLSLSSDVSEIRARITLLKEIGAYNELMNTLQFCKKEKQIEFEDVWSYDAHRKNGYLDVELAKCERKQSVIQKIKNS